MYRWLVLAIFLALTLSFATLSRAVCDPIIGVSDWIACSFNDSTGQIDCWGTDQFGLLTNIPASGGALWLDGGDDTFCALKADSSMVCWGSDGGSIVSDTPGGTGWQMVTPGTDSACAMEGDSTITCWGDNVAFFDVAEGGFTYADIRGDQDIYCGVRTTGALACWGFNFVDGAVSPPAGTAWTFVDACGDHACALKNDNTIECWGDNSDGENTVPVAAYVDVAVGLDFTCARLTDLTIDCWGADHGVGLQTPPAGNFSLIDCGGATCCAVGTDGDVECWGENTAGIVTGSAGAECIATVASWLSIAVGM